MTEADRELMIKDTLDMIDEMHPQDHFERMLINQLAASHQMAMHCFKRATNPEMPDAEGRSVTSRMPKS